MIRLEQRRRCLHVHERGGGGAGGAIKTPPQVGSGRGFQRTVRLFGYVAWLRGERRSERRSELRALASRSEKMWLSGSTGSAERGGHSGRRYRPQGGARGLRAGAGSRASPTIRKVPPSRIKTLKRAFGSGWQHTLGNNPVEPVLRRFRYRHAV